MEVFSGNIASLYPRLFWLSYYLVGVMVEEIKFLVKLEQMLDLLCHLKSNISVKTKDFGTNLGERC